MSNMTITILETSALIPTPDIASFNVTRVDFSMEAIATQHPVEEGAEVVDHTQTLPLRFTAEVYVTGSPAGIPQPFAVEDAIGFLERALGKPCTVVIQGEGTFSPMVLEAAPHARTVQVGRSFDLRFKHVRIAKSLSVVIPPRAPAPVAAVGAPTEQALGVQSTTSGTPTVGPSALFQFGGSVVDLVKMLP